MRPWRSMISAACAALLSCNALYAQPPAPYEAEYNVYRNGKRIGRASITLETTGDGVFRYSRHSKGEKGLAAFLNTSETETAEFEADNGSYRPKNYYSRLKVAGRKRGWEAQFDWQESRITGNTRDAQFDLATEPGLLDPVSLQFALIDALAEDHRPLEFRVLDGAKIEERKFTAAPAAGIKTALGCTDSIKVDRVRVNSTRYTTSWHAVAAAYIPVRLDHGKHGDKTNSLRLERLSIDGKAITFSDTCAGDEEA